MTDLEGTDLEFSQQEWNEGSPIAFKAFYFREYPHYFSFALALLPDRTSAINVTTEALFLLWKKHRDFKSLINCKAFLYTTVRNNSLQYLKYLQEAPAAGIYTANQQHWPSLPPRDLVEILAYTEDDHLPPTQVARER